MNINIDVSRATIDKDVYKAEQPNIEKAMDKLWSGEVDLSEWVKAPMSMDHQTMEDMLNTALAAQDTCSLFLIIGNGGSFYGIKAVIEAVQDKSGTAPEVLFVGEAVSPFHYYKVLEKMRHYEVNVCVISRTGETLETLVSYKVIRDAMIRRYGEEIAAKRTIILTGQQESTLRTMGLEDGSGVFEIPTSFAGSFSVLSPASLFPMAVAGVDIKSFLSGAEVVATDPGWDIDLFNYSITRTIMARAGKKMELIKIRDMGLESMAQYICQLYGETQTGAESKLFTKEMSLSRDFMGMINFLIGRGDDYLETELIIEENLFDMELPDELKSTVRANSIADINEILGKKIVDMYQEETMDKVDIKIKDGSAFSIGQLVYFLLMSATLTGYLLGAEPMGRQDMDDIKSVKRAIMK